MDYGEAIVKQVLHLDGATVHIERTDARILVSQELFAKGDPKVFTTDGDTFTIHAGNGTATYRIIGPGRWDDTRLCELIATTWTPETSHEGGE